jgi:hypothetical protein
MFDNFFNRFEPQPGQNAQGIAVFFRLVRPIFGLKPLALVFLALLLIGAARNSTDFIIFPLGLILILVGWLMRRAGW